MITYLLYTYSFVLFCMSFISLVPQSCPTLCNPMDCSTPGFHIVHYLPEFAQTHIHWVSDWPYHSLLPLFFSSPQYFPELGSFPMSWLFTSGGQSIGVSAASVLPIRGWFPLGLTGLILLLSKGLSRVFSEPQFESINFLALSLPYGSTLTSVHDYWKNHSFP